MVSISDNPQPSDLGYSAHINEINAIFDRENVDGLLLYDLITKVYSERFEYSTNISIVHRK
jgi:hypothetical protein